MFSANAALSSPVASIDLATNFSESIVGTVAPGTQVEFQYTALENLSVSGLSFSATGPGLSPIFQLEYGFSATGGANFLTVGGPDAAGAGLAFLNPSDIPGGSGLSTGDSFSVFIENPSTQTVAVTTTATTGQLSAPTQSQATVPTVPSVSVPLSSGGVEKVLGSLVGGTAALFEFQAAEDVSVTGISLSATSTNGGGVSALDFLEFGYLGSSAAGLQARQASGGASTGFGFLDPDNIPGGSNLPTGGAFSFFIMNNSSEEVALTSTVTTGPSGIAPVPLPAGVWLLLAGLGAMVGLRRRA